MMENIMNAVNAVMSACRESLNHTNDDYERVTILVSRVGWERLKAATGPSAPMARERTSTATSLPSAS